MREEARRKRLREQQKTGRPSAAPTSGLRKRALNFAPIFYPYNARISSLCPASISPRLYRTWKPSSCISGPWSVCFPIHSPRYAPQKREGRVPVEPIISLCGRVPGLRLRFWANFVVPALQDERFGILAMTNAQMNPTFAAYYRRCITKMEVRVIEGTNFRMRLSIYLKPESQEGWMSVSRVLADYRGKTYDWMERSGLSTEIWVCVTVQAVREICYCIS
jgi:hypothetical protein